MGWQDRDYGPQMNYGGGTYGNPLLNLLLGSFPLGTWFGIRVRIHATLIWFFVFQLLRAGRLGWADVAVSEVVLFSIILLHEFGHCFGAHMVGGHPDHVLLWPFGGLAYTDHPHNWWARFVTVISGPMVNVILIPILAVPFFMITHALPPMNPLAAWDDGVWNAYFVSHPGAWNIYQVTGGRWLLWTIALNYSLLIFNLMPIFPLDGGQMLQSVLWKFIGYYRSMNISCIVGMVAAVPFALWGLYEGTLFTFFLGLVGFMTCFQQRRAIKMMALEGAEEQYDLSAAWDQAARVGTARRGKLKNRSVRNANKRAREERLEQVLIDKILVKVKEQGLHSLTWGEKRALKKATERQRQRDVARRG